METILIVDDSSTVRKFLTATLKTRNFRCIEASDGFDALEKLAQNPQILADAKRLSKVCRMPKEDLCLCYKN